MKEIRLTKNKIALVDDEDYGEINKHKWYASNCRGRYYAMRNVKKKTLLMHRAIIDAPTNMEIDHINGNCLDNRKENLRICRHSDNRRNTKKTKPHSSIYKGVSWHKPTNKWQARISGDYKLIHLGYFDNEREAAVAYNKAALKYHGKYASLNEI